MFETHSQRIKGHLLTGMAESFTGGKGKTANWPKTGMHSLFSIKCNLHTIQQCNAITNFAIATNAEISTILRRSMCCALLSKY